MLSLTPSGEDFGIPMNLRHLDPHVKQYTVPQGFFHSTHNQLQDNKFKATKNVYKVSSRRKTATA